jgi:hypothetical protein
MKKKSGMKCSHGGKASSRNGYGGGKGGAKGGGKGGARGGMKGGYR